MYLAFLEVKRKNLTFPGSGKVAPGELGEGGPRFFLTIGMGSRMGGWMVNWMGKPDG